MTTTLPGYTFNTNTLYAVGLYTPACECTGEGFEYQMTFTSRNSSFDMTEAQQQEIIDAILNGVPLAQSSDESDNFDLSKGAENVQIYPNPASDQLTISTGNVPMERIEIYTMTGQKLENRKIENGSL